MVETDPSIALWKAKKTIGVATGVAVSQQLVRVVLKSLGYSRFGKFGRRVYGYLRRRAPIVCKIELGANDDIILCPSSRGFI